MIEFLTVLFMYTMVKIYADLQPKVRIKEIYIDILKTTEDEQKLFRALLLLEHLLHRGVMSVTKIDGLYSKVADKLENNSSHLIVNKTRKLSLTLNALKSASP